MWCYPTTDWDSREWEPIAFLREESCSGLQGGWQDFLLLKRWESWKSKTTLEIEMFWDGLVGKIGRPIILLKRSSVGLEGGRPVNNWRIRWDGWPIAGRKEGWVWGGFPSSLVVLLPLFIQMPRLPARSQLLQAELGGPWCLVPPKAGSL